MLNKQTMEKLFEMKLDGMAGAFKEQMGQVEATALSFEERLAMLVDREYTRREEKRLTRRLKTAKLKQPACIEDIDYRHPRGLDKQTVRSLAACQWVKGHQNIIITGPTGVGKTYLSCAFANKVCRVGYTAIYARLPRLLNDIAISKADGSYMKLLGKLVRADVLVVDDWGLAPLTEMERRDFLEVIDDRQDTRSTIMTSQLPISNWHDNIGDPTIADAILDRLLHNSHRVTLKGESMRKVRAGRKENLTQADQDM